VIGIGLVVLTLYRARLDTLALALARLDRVVAVAGATDSGAVRAGVREVRLAYKRVECVVEYVDPVEAAALNGPGVEGLEEAEDDPGEPDEETSLGLLRSVEQAVYRFPVLFAGTRQKARAAIGGARLVVGHLRAGADTVRLGEAQIVAAAREELVRVAALGIAGEDSRAARAGLAESRVALIGTREMLGRLDSGVERALDIGIGLLGDSSEFDTFNRLRFIVAVAVPLRLFVAPRPVVPAPAATGGEVALGAALFRDTRLSGTGTRSCAFCHQPARGFTDGLARAAPLPSRPATLRHTPTLLNVAMADAWFDDGRAGSLEEQVRDVVTNPNEMGGRIPSRAVERALAAYERTLVGFRTRVDRALGGDTLALTEGERHGFNVFMGKAGCGTCHYLPRFSGMRPTRGAQSEFEVLGVPARADTVGATVDSDSGRARVTHDPADWHAFKTPGLRFLVAGGPYMHNGVFQTLEQVVDFYDRGGGAGIGERLPNQTLSPAPLHLTRGEKDDLLAFLRALADRLSQ
jgi:cytochrome c peroxidase